MNERNVFKEIALVDARIDALERTLIPLLVGLLSDSVRGESLADMLQNIQGTRLRVHAALRTVSQKDATDNHRITTEMATKAVDKIFDDMAGMLADVSFEQEL